MIEEHGAGQQSGNRPKMCSDTTLKLQHEDKYPGLECTVSGEGANASCSEYHIIVLTLAKHICWSSVFVFRLLLVLLLALFLFPVLLDFFVCRCLVSLLLVRHFLESVELFSIQLIEF